MDSRFGLLCWVRFLRRVTSVTFEAHFCSLPVFSETSSRIFLRSFVSKEVSNFQDSFSIKNISLVTLTQTDTKASNFSFTVIIFPSMISQNAIDFLTKWKKRIEKRQVDISRGLLLTWTIRFRRSKLSDCPGWWLHTLSFSQTRTIPGLLPSLTVEYPLTSHTRDIPLLLKILCLDFRPSTMNFKWSPLHCLGFVIHFVSLCGPTND